MQTAEQRSLGPTFEQRNHRALRLAELAPDIGRAGLSGAQTEQQDNLEARREDELISTLAEGLKGQIDTHYTFEMIDGKLVAKDGEPIEDMLVRALRKDIKLASRDPFFVFLPKRSRAELDNFRRVQAMALGQEDFNSLLEVSVYTEELDTSEENRQKLIKAAQKPYWGRTMTRLSHWDGKEAHIITLSSDNLEAANSFDNDGALRGSVSLFKEAAAKRLDYSFIAQNSTDVLAEPISLKITDGSWRHLANDLVAEVDTLLTQLHGGEWHQGRPRQESIDLQKYVSSQTEIVKGLRAAEKKLALHYQDFEGYKAAFHTEIYNCLALLEKRLQLGKTEEKIVDYVSASAGAGELARAEGRSYDACGMVISANQSQTDSTAQQTAHESLMRLENRRIQCPDCKEKVIVPKEYLEAGHLYCTECGYDLDVCTGKKTFDGRSERRAPRTISALDMLANWLKVNSVEDRVKRLYDQVRGPINELDRRRIEKLIVQDETELIRLRQAA